jgi:hypothetical protein
MEFASAIETASDKGIVSGYKDQDGNATGMFGPLDLVNRAAVSKIVVNALRVY